MIKKLVTYNIPKLYFLRLMDSKFLHQFQKQASIFFKEKFKAARLVLTDATPVQLLTEEILSEGAPLSVPDTRSMRLISRAAFEVDDYSKIVDILHKRLITYERRNWRTAYKAVTLLEHLLTHGPLRVAEEFKGDQDTIIKMAKFQHVDEKGFNWGLTVQKKSERVLKLIEDTTFLKEERARTRKLTSEINGFGSFCKLSIPEDEDDDTWNQSTSRSTIFRSNSEFIDRERGEGADSVLDSEYAGSITRKAPVLLDGSRSLSSQKPGPNPEVVLEEHPFFGKEHQAMNSLLS